MTGFGNKKVFPIFLLLSKGMHCKFPMCSEWNREGLIARL